jgi:signal transduction histidine kinase
MQISETDFNPSSNDELLLAYVADLELEVDRLRKQSQLIQNEARQTILRLRELTTDVAPTAEGLREIVGATQHFADVVHDLHEHPGYHPAHDQVVAIAVRPLAEQVFRWHQRISDAPNAVLHLDLKTEYLDWFPGRLRHILDNLISNSLKYRDTTKGECRVSLSLTARPEGYELRVSDNGLGMPWNRRAEAFELFYRVGPTRGAGLGVGIAVVKLLVEQSGGTLTVESGNGQGTSFVAVLPRYTTDDFLN